MFSNPTPDGHEQSRTPDSATRVPAFDSLLKIDVLLLVLQSDGFFLRHVQRFVFRTRNSWIFLRGSPRARTARLALRSVLRASGEADPALWRDWEAYAQAPDAARSPVETSNLLVAMAPHVSRFVNRLFTSAQTPRRRSANARAGRSVPFQGGFRAPPRAAAAEGRRARRATAEDDAVVSRPDGVMRSTATSSWRIARAGCALLDREKTDEAGSRRRRSNALKRWCAARIHDPAYRAWVVFRFPENLDYWHLVEVQRPDRSCRKRCSARRGGCAGATASS